MSGDEFLQKKKLNHEYRVEFYRYDYKNPSIYRSNELFQDFLPFCKWLLEGILRKSRLKSFILNKINNNWDQ